MTLTKLTQADLDAAAKAAKIAALRAQLAALDSEVSRSAENMYKQGIYTSISDREKAAIAQKEILRAEITELQ
jgi:hypothetical protein